VNKKIKIFIFYLHLGLSPSLVRVEVYKIKGHREFVNVEVSIEAGLRISILKGNVIEIITRSSLN
jgi:hypothetical protein